MTVEKPRLLLHICCAPCAAAVIRRLAADYLVTGYFYNPNIFPEAEYRRRLDSLLRLAEQWQFPLEIGSYDQDLFQRAVAGMENEPESGRRCEVCYGLRLEQAAVWAEASGCTTVAATLTVGPQKRAALVNAVGREVCARRGITFLEADWKKRDGFRQSVGLSRQLGLYRQTYCGCEFSFRITRNG